MISMAVRIALMDTRDQTAQVTLYGIAKHNSLSSLPLSIRTCSHIVLTKQIDVVECPLDTFGKDCESSCNCRYKDQCERVTGICPNGCPEWRVGIGEATCEFYLGKVKRKSKSLVLF